MDDPVAFPLTAVEKSVSVAEKPLTRRQSALVISSLTRSERDRRQPNSCAANRGRQPIGRGIQQHGFWHVVLSQNLIR
jgi:hypothetical protein